jgi:hypothetical protein
MLHRPVEITSRKLPDAILLLLSLERPVIARKLPFNFGNRKSWSECLLSPRKQTFHFHAAICRLSTQSGQPPIRCKSTRTTLSSMTKAIEGDYNNKDVVLRGTQTP